MVLTHVPRPTNHNDNSFPTLQLLILGGSSHSYSYVPFLVTALTRYPAICRVSEPIALASCFPYAIVLVRDFHVGDRASASFWAGIFISSFALAEALTGLAWGGVSDKVGRKPVLLLGSAGTLISLLIVGFATNFWMALAGRTLGGLLSTRTKNLLVRSDWLTRGQMETLE